MSSLAVADSASLDAIFASAAANEYDPEMLTKVKDDWIAKQLTVRRDEFTNNVPLRVLVGSWNVNGKVIKDDLRPWLLRDENPPDVYVIGFQELDLSAEAFVFNNSPLEEEWTRRIGSVLNERGAYTKIKSRQLVGMLMLVFIKDEHKPFLTDVHSQATGTGIMGVMGNKGGVSIRFQVYDTTLCFVNSHLAASSGQCERRNQDFHEICKRTIFNQKYTIFDHDQAYWMGDLNYRIAADDADVRHVANDGDWSCLWALDELCRERKANRVFNNFEEGHIEFKPTYKYDPGTDDFDTSEKQRAPAWCDRILWKGHGVEQLSYTSHPQLKGSDHKPISALFTSPVQVVIPDRFHAVRMAIIHDLDKMENECMPDVTLSTSFLDYGDVRYLQPYNRELVLSNVGQVMVQFRFIPKLDDSLFCRPWLRINPPVGMIAPGQKATVDLTVYVDQLSAALLNTGADKIEDILIVHLENGKDYFVSLQGHYLATCFAYPLEDLCRKVGPVRGNNIETDKDSDEEDEPPTTTTPATTTVTTTSASTAGEGDSSALLRPVSSSSPADSVIVQLLPKELWRLVDYIIDNGLDVPNLFFENGLADTVAFIRECLDTGTAFPASLGDEGTHAVAETLVCFLGDLPSPIIPDALYQQCIEYSSTRELCCQKIAQLPNINYAVLLYLVSLMRELILHREQNGLTPEKLSFLFGSVLLRQSRQSRKKQSQSGYEQVTADIAKRKARFIYHLIVEE